MEEPGQHLGLDLASGSPVEGGEGPAAGVHQPGVRGGGVHPTYHSIGALNYTKQYFLLSAQSTKVKSILLSPNWSDFIQATNNTVHRKYELSISLPFF